jgi:hypothetical protein
VTALELSAYSQLISEATTRAQLDAMRERIKRDAIFRDEWTDEQRETLRRVFSMRFKEVR